MGSESRNANVDGANLDTVQLSFMVPDYGGIVPCCTGIQSQALEVGVVGEKTLPELFQSLDEFLSFKGFRLLASMIHLM